MLDYDIRERRFVEIDRDAEQKKAALRAEILRTSAEEYRKLREQSNQHIMVAVPVLTERQKITFREAVAGTLTRARMRELYPELREGNMADPKSECGELDGLIYLTAGFDQIEYRLTRLGQAVFEQLVVGET